MCFLRTSRRWPDYIPALVEHAQTCFGAEEDVLKFFGRKLTASFAEARMQTWIKRRPEGTRVNHSLKSNRLKMYDKAGSVRIETTINAPTEFKVRRQNGRGKLERQPLRKGVAWLWRYAEVRRSSKGRYLDALTAEDDDGAARRLLDRATKPVRRNGRRQRALQPLSEWDQALFLAALRGEHRLRGFSNRDLRERLYTQEAATAAERRRRCGRVTRLDSVVARHGLGGKKSLGRVAIG